MNVDNPIEVLGIDAGGTMTDTFFVAADGQFIVGKAQSSDDETAAVIESSIDALLGWDRSLEEVFSEMITCVYSGTAMLNRVVSRKGNRTGLICSKGFEDNHRMGRALQSYLGYAFEDRIHLNAHHYDDPLVTIQDTRGVTERIDCQGTEVIPVNLSEAAMAAKALIARDVKAIVISFLNSHTNAKHERAVRDICIEEVQKSGKAIPVFASCDYYPSRKESHRTNTTVLEAYAAEPSRVTLKALSDQMAYLGGGFDVRVMASHGGTISWKAKELARTLVSGPIGGVIGAAYLGKELGYENIACSDIGGTSFDMALITKGNFAIGRDKDMARLVLSLPLVGMDTVGAGAGSFVRIDPYSEAIKLGPDSAGFRVGTCWQEGGIETVSVTDCHLVLGYLNPDNFLGGTLQLDAARSRQCIKEQIADKLNLSVEEAAAGVIELLDASLRQHLADMISSKGYAPADFVCFSYGGAGPVHAYGYTKGLGFQETIVPAWAAGFSAFGCASAEFEYRYDKSVDVAIPPDSTDEAKVLAVKELQFAWDELREKVLEEFRVNGFEDSEVTLAPGFSMQYMGQLNDLEIVSPLDSVASSQDWEQLTIAFEETFSRVYARAARSPELGYGVTTAIMHGTVNVKKPTIPEEPDVGPEVSEEAKLGTRKFYFEHCWHDAQLYLMEKIHAGNRLKGPCIIESDATTFVVPPGFESFMDTHRLFHLIEV